jgi:hypothetical protein
VTVGFGTSNLRPEDGAAREERDSPVSFHASTQLKTGKNEANISHCEASGFAMLVVSL